MSCWLKPWGRGDDHFRGLPKGVITFPKHPGRPRVDMGDLLVIFAVGTGKLVAVMRAKSGIYDLPDNGPGGKNERYPFACDGEVHEGLDLSDRIEEAPSIDILPNAKKLKGAIQQGHGHIHLTAEDCETACAAIRAAIDAKNG